MNDFCKCLDYAKLIMFADDSTTLLTHDQKKSVAINWKLKMRAQEVEKKKTLKFLGVIIDECLQWKDHTDYVSPKVIKSLVLIRGMKYILHERDLKPYTKNFTIQWFIRT